jgi:hypothetical protein
MARRRKKTKKHGRRRMGATPRGIMGALIEGGKAVLGVGVGIAAGRWVNSTVLTTATGTPSQSPTLVGVAEFGAGALLVGKARASFVKGIGAGLGGNGLIYALGAKGLALLPASVGYGPDPMRRPTRPMLQGFRDVPAIGAFPKPNAIGASRERSRQAAVYAGVYG